MSQLICFVYVTRQQAGGGPLLCANKGHVSVVIVTMSDKLILSQPVFNLGLQ